MARGIDGVVVMEAVGLGMVIALAVMALALGVTVIAAIVKLVFWR